MTKIKEMNFSEREKSNTENELWNLLRQHEQLTQP